MINELNGKLSRQEILLETQAERIEMLEKERDDLMAVSPDKETLK
jgi:hypothetical protein